MVCRLCLNDPPSESGITKLYHNSDNIVEGLELVKLIEKYLDIEVRHDDGVSTMICKDCHMHLEEFHKFRNLVEEKQSTLHGEFFQIQIKQEGHLNDDGDKIIPDTWGMEHHGSSDYPMDIVKSELNDEREEQEVVAPDLLCANDVHIGEAFTKCANKEVFPNDMHTSEEAASSQKIILDEIKRLNETVNNQNRTIVGLVSEIKLMLVTNMTPVQTSLKYSDLFPIPSIDKLNEIENETNEETKHAVVSALKGIIGNCSIQKELERIIDISVILEFNVDGKQRKLRFLQYPKFVDSLYKAAFTEGLTKKLFLKNLRQAFRLAKNRFHKKQSLKRKRVSSSSEDSEHSEDEISK